MMPHVSWSARSLVAAALSVLLFVIPSSLLAQADEYSVEEYLALREAMETADLNRIATEPGTPERTEAVETSLGARRDMIRYINGWLADGTMPDNMRDSAISERLVLVENVIQLNIGLARCDEAAEALALMRNDFEQAGDEDYLRALAAAEEGVDECRANSEVVDPDDPVDEDPDDGDQTDDPDTNDDEDTTDDDSDEDVADPDLTTPPTVESAGEPTGAIVLVAIGGALLAGGIGWDLALLSDRSDYLDARDECESDGTRCDDASGLRSDLSDAKLPVGLLYGVGAALTTAGVIWLAMPNAEISSPDVSLRIDVAPGYAGVSLSGVLR